MRRSKIFPLRLEPSDLQDLERRAEREGLSRSDVIRTAMGWPNVRRASTPMAKQLAEARVPTEEVDREEAPGLAALQALSGRIRKKGRRR